MTKKAGKFPPGRGWALFLGGLGSCLMILLAVLGPLAAPYDVASRGMVDRVAQRLQAPSAAHWLGTDHLGTDVFSLVLVGARNSLFIGLGAAAASTLLGLVVGLVSGYCGGLFDILTMQVTDVFLAFPSLVLAILIAASMGPGAISVILALVLTGWAPLARIVRGLVLSLRREEFILASRAIGCSHPRIVLTHILPNCLPLVIVLFTMRAGVMILAESSLSFLGLGSPAGTASWGVMVDTGRSYIGTAPWCSMAPATAIALTVISFNFLGDGLRDMLDPKLKGRI